MTQLAKMQEALQAINTRQMFLERLAYAAMAYINISSTEPNIHHKAVEAWHRYKDAEADALRAGVLPFPSEKYGSESSAKSP